MSDAEAHIETAAIVAGHDARAEIVVVLRHANGGRSEVRLDEEAARYVLDRAGITELDALRGRPWHVLRAALDAAEPA